MQKIYLVTMSMRGERRKHDAEVLRMYSDRCKAVEYAKALLDDVEDVEEFSEDTCWMYRTSAMDEVWLEVRDYILE